MAEREELEKVLDQIFSFRSILQSDIMTEELRVSINDSMKKAINTYVNAVHKYSITPPKEGAKKQLWSTKVVIDHKQKNITAKTKDLLLEKLFAFYSDEAGMILENLFTKAMIDKQETECSGKTLAEYNRLWKKYYEPYPIAKKSITELNYSLWVEHSEQIIKKHKLTKKQFKQVVIVANLIYAYCIRKKYFAVSPIRDLVVSGGLPFFSEPVYNEIKAPALTEHQIEKVKEWCNMQLKQPKARKIYPYTILFNLRMALRVGELRALHWSDVDFNNRSIVVNKQKVVSCSMDENLKITYSGMEGQNHLKAYENARILPLPEEAYQILMEIKALDLDEEYVFPIRYHTYNEKIKLAVQFAGADGNSFRTHSLRSTAATMAYRKCHDVKTVQALLGHTNTEMTNKYVKSVDTYENLQNLMSII